MIRVRPLLSAAFGRLFLTLRAFAGGGTVAAASVLIGVPVLAYAVQVKLTIVASIAATGEVLQTHEQFIPVSDQGEFLVVQLTHGNDTWQFYEGYVAGRVTKANLSSGYGLQNAKAFPVAFQVTFELPMSLLPTTHVGGRTSGIFGSSSTLDEATIASLGSSPFFEGQLDGSPCSHCIPRHFR
jgi:hypothetical protein